MTVRAFGVANGGTQGALAELLTVPSQAVVPFEGQVSTGGSISKSLDRVRVRAQREHRCGENQDKEFRHLFSTWPTIERSYASDRSKSLNTAGIKSSFWILHHRKSATTVRKGTL